MERFFGARATVSSDVYEAAVCLYVMITGGLPWADPRSPRERLSPRPPSALGVGGVVGLDGLFAEVLAAEPAHRPRTIDELVAKVRAVGWAGETMAAPPPATTARVRRRGVGVAIAVALATAAAVAAVVVMLEPAASQGTATAPDAGAAAVPDAAAAAVAVAMVVPPDAAAVTITPIAVDAAVVVPDAAPAARKGRSKGTGTSTRSGRGRGTGTGSAPKTAATGACERIAALYCTAEFKATEGNLAGELCRKLGKTFRDMEAIPEQQAWCRDSYPELKAAVDERLRQFREGIGPPQRSP
jgi:hypothetical protein